MYQLMSVFVLVGFLVSPCGQAEQKESQCFGTTSNGRLQDGVNLPSAGANFKAYSWLGRQLGRTYVHSGVYKIVVATYKALHKSHPKKVFMYAETGFQTGGRFKPHKTHQNGLSLDHMVPVLKEGKSVHLPTHALNKLGYDIEFSPKGIYGEYKIDFEALAALIVELHRQAKKAGHEIWRVIFDPELTPFLLQTDSGKYLRKNLQFSKKRSWVRHDEHIHVDFKIPCEAL
ncbi:MAG: penicillin-insensitive murein endopeptidase [Pseudomonadota bacterium]